MKNNKTINMKTILISFFFFFMTSFFAFGQIYETESNMSLGVQSANEVILDDIQPNEAYKLWKDYFKKYGKIKRNKKANEYYSTGVRINKIFTASNIDVYTRFEERGSSTMMTMWVDLGMSFINSKGYPTEYKAVVEMLDDFRVEANLYMVQKDLDAAEKELGMMKKDLVKLEKINIKLHDKIDNYENKIVDTKKDINQNLVGQEDKKIEIDRQLETLKMIQKRMKQIKN
jgi:hypothetical protein